MLFLLFWNELAAARGQITVHVSQAECSGFAQCAARRAARLKQRRPSKDLGQSSETCWVLYIPQMRNSKNAVIRRVGSANYPHDRRNGCFPKATNTTRPSTLDMKR